MNMHHLDMLWRHVRWSHRQDIRDEGTSHETHRWKLVKDFVTNLMSITHSSSLLQILSVLMSPY